MDNIIQEIANVGITIFCIVLVIFLVNWLDRNVFNKNRYYDRKDEDND